MRLVAVSIVVLTASFLLRILLLLGLLLSDGSLGFGPKEVANVGRHFVNAEGEGRNMT